MGGKIVEKKTPHCTLPHFIFSLILIFIDNVQISLDYDTWLIILALMEFIYEYEKKSPISNESTHLNVNTSIIDK